MNKPNIILNGEKLTAFLLRSGMRVRCLPAPLLEVLPNAARKGKNGILIGKGEIKLFVHS